MIAAVALAWIFPDLGAKGSPLHPELINKFGVALVFFMSGLLLSFDSLKSGAMRWQLHLLIQLSTFAMFPLFGVAIYYATKGSVPADLSLGLFFLCALPSTVSSSVAMTAAARGNVAVAVFNATLSSILGIFITPVLVSYLFENSGYQMDIVKVILDLVKWLLLPLMLGQVVRPFLGVWATRNKRYLNRFDRIIILILIYTSFCDSVKWGVWEGHGSAVINTFIIALALFVIAVSIMWSICNYFGFSVADRAAVVFCGSKKSLATGVPMAQLMFAAHPGLSMILLPIMIYHPLQLLLCGPIASRWASRPAD